MEVISEFLFVVLLIVDREFELALLGAEHDGLAVHAADHVEGRLRFAAQRQFEEVFGNALLDGFAQFILDLEEAVGGTKAADALMRPLVVVIFEPEFDALAGGVETVELGADDEVLPDRGPEALDLAQRHGMLRPGFDVRDTILFEFGLEAAHAAPVGVLAPVVGEHLFGRLKLAHRDAIHFDDCRRRGAAKQIRADDEARIIIHERDEIRVTAAEAEREDVRLPHLIGRGPLEETRANHVPLFGRRACRHQLGRVQVLAHGLRAGRQKENPAQDLRDAFDAKRWVFSFEHDNLLGDGRRELGLAALGVTRLQARLAQLAILLDPVAQAALGHADLGADVIQPEPFLEPHPHGPEFFLRCVATQFFAGARPPRGALTLLLYYCLFTHVNTPSIIGVSTSLSSISVSRSGR